MEHENLREHQTTHGTITIRNEIWGRQHRQTDGSILGHTARQRVAGYIDYALFEGDVYINYIRVHHEVQRQGLASKLYAHLQHEYPGTKIYWGLTTPDGTELKRALRRERKTKRDGRQSNAHSH